MPAVHVCPLSQIAVTVEQAGASHLVTLINDATPVVRPGSIPAERHLFLAMHDITEAQDDMVAPNAAHVRELIAFAEAWDRSRPMVIHCYAGISRSTAAAFITVCAVRPERSEAEIAAALRAASPYATPNALLVALADDLLGRDGRMVAAIDAIGRGEMAFEGVPFVLPLGDDS